MSKQEPKKKYKWQINKPQQQGSSLNPLLKNHTTYVVEQPYIFPPSPTNSRLRRERDEEKRWGRAGDK